jgi:hypothetical protein
MKKYSLPSAFWTRIAEGFVGLFFIAAAYTKGSDAFFGKATAPLQSDFTYWLNSGFTFSWYRPVLEFFMPYAESLGVIVILLQGSAGILLLVNRKIRWAGLALIFVQTNILLSVYHGWGFIHFVGISIWLGFFYFWKEQLSPRKWMLLTYALLFLYLNLIHGRWIRGDGIITSVSGQFAHYAQDIMSITPQFKQWILQASSWPFFSFLWAGMWWIHVAVFLLLFTRFRLYVGMLWLTLLTLRELTWTNGITSEGVLWVLVVFVWLAEEERMERETGVVRLLPRIRLPFWK